MDKLQVGFARQKGENHYQRGLLSAGEALRLMENTRPSLALISIVGKEGAGDVLLGVRGVLGNCPLMGVVSPTVPKEGEIAEEEVQLLIFGSPHLQAKVGIGGSERENWHENIAEAFQEAGTRLLAQPPMSTKVAWVILIESITRNAEPLPSPVL